VRGRRRLPAGRYFNWEALEYDYFLPLRSLQVGFGREQIVDGVEDLGAEFESFADTTAAIEGLDLVIAVDTSVAHLGGALGVETWILILYEPDWRWFRDGESSPFYGTVRLFRQSEPGCSCPVTSGNGVCCAEPAAARSATSARVKPWSKSAAGEMPSSPQAGHTNSCCAATDNWDEVIERVWAALQERVSNSSGNGSILSTFLEATST
jgi:hypothetical protein